MLAIDFQLILLFAAGAIWVIGKAVTASQKLRHRIRMKVEQQERQRTMKFEERSDYSAPEPTLKPDTLEQPKLAAAAVRRPPRTKKRIVRRRVIRRTVHKAQPKQPVGIRERLRDRRSLRDAIVLREILGPPKALRGRRMR